jgi:hypothetical protein
MLPYAGDGENAMSPLKTLSSGAPARVEEKAQLAIHVAFTSDRETVAALRQASTLAAGLNARLQVVAPQVVPYGVDLDQPPVTPEFTAGKMLRLAAEAGVEADVRVVLCRDRVEGLESVLGAHAVVIAGEKRLARQLVKRGHQVLLVDRHLDRERESSCSTCFTESLPWSSSR